MSTLEEIVAERWQQSEEHLIAITAHQLYERIDELHAIALKTPGKLADYEDDFEVYARRLYAIAALIGVAKEPEAA